MPPRAFTVPAAGGLAVPVAARHLLRITTPHGAQAADFWAFSADGNDWSSPMHTWVTTRSLKLRPGDVVLSRFRRPLLEIVEDGAEGCHDMLIAACDQARYEQFGVAGPHANCSDNLRAALARLGRPLTVVPQPINLFTNTHVEADGALVSPPNPVAPGAFVVVRALADVVCVVSSCPFDLGVVGWTINAPGGPTELELTLED